MLRCVFVLSLLCCVLLLLSFSSSFSCLLSSLWVDCDVIAIAIAIARGDGTQSEDQGKQRTPNNKGNTNTHNNNSNTVQRGRGEQRQGRHGEFTLFCVASKQSAKESTQKHTTCAPVAARPSLDLQDQRLPDTRIHEAMSIGPRVQQCARRCGLMAHSPLLLDVVMDWGNGRRAAVRACTCGSPQGA